jgi:hypothetical protein
MKKFNSYRNNGIHKPRRRESQEGKLFDFYA